MAWQQRAQAWMAQHRLAVHVGLVLFLFAGGAISATFVEPQGSERPTDWFAYVLILAAAGSIWWRRRNPLLALVLSLVFLMPYWVLDYPGGFDPVMSILFYSATRHGGPDRRRVWQVVGTCLFVVVAVATMGVVAPVEDLPAMAVFAIAIIHGAAAAVGEALYQRARYVAELEQRAAMLEADVENKSALAAVEERTRIAREMHDIIAHGMSTVVVQAQAGQSVVDTNPAKAREVLRTIEHIGRDSVDEMRRMLGVLRNGNGEIELEPQPGFDDLGALAHSVEETGVDVEIVVDGDPRPVPPGLELTGYRVVQEALTNVVRHAGRPVKARAQITYGPEALEIEVIDDGLGAAASPSTAGTGHGLLGMGERVDIYNGTLASGPRKGGGYRVAVSLPMSTPVDA